MAIGVDDDYISVENMPFQPKEDSTLSDLMAERNSAANLMRNKELVQTGSSPW
jgi:hypothetical protein